MTRFYCGWFLTYKTSKLVYHSKSRPQQTPEGSSESAKPSEAQTDEYVENFEMAGWKIWALCNIPQAVFVAASVLPLADRWCQDAAVPWVRRLSCRSVCCLWWASSAARINARIQDASIIPLQQDDYNTLLCGRLTQGSRRQSVET